MEISLGQFIKRQEEKKIKHLRKTIRNNKHKAKNPTPQEDILEDCGIINTEQ